MRVIGIICEYDPFHLGHAWHIAQTRRTAGGESAVVCCMSGHWTQRAECAIADKWTRAGLALAGGADLVVELPLPWALSTAERFAQGGVGLLAALGAEALSFGSESGDLPALRQTAECLDTPEYQTALRGALKAGEPFARAGQRAAEALLGPAAACLAAPNDNLGVEYLRAIWALERPMEALTIPRRGAGHHSASPVDGFASASQIRRLLWAGRGAEAGTLLPPGTVEALGEPARLDWAERAILARLRTMTVEDFAALPDSGAAEGLPVRLYRCARQGAGLEEFYTLAKTKRYTHARLRRLAVSAFLGLREADIPSAPLYVRVLGMNRRGMEVLRGRDSNPTVPVLTKPAHVKSLSLPAQSLFALESRGTDLYGLCFSAPRPCGLEWTHSPVVRMETE